MSDKLRGPNSSLWITEAQEPGGRRAVLFLHRQEAPDDAPMLPRASSHLTLPIAQSGNCHNSLTFKTITGIILVSCLKNKRTNNTKQQRKNATV